MDNDIQAAPAAPQAEVLDGIDLILSIGGKALGYSTGCKITTTAETTERLTKEAASGKWKDKIVKNFAESISAEGCVLKSPDSGKPTYNELRTAMLSGTPVTASYATRVGDTREGTATNCYSGSYIITSLELDGQADGDAKYSVQLENSGKIDKSGQGIAITTAS